MYIKYILNPKNISTSNIPIKIILEYSDKNKIANPPLPYSTLNPDTNSDSPSAKSKGERLVSATKDDDNKKKNNKY